MRGLKTARHLLFSLATVDSKEDSASDLPCAADPLPPKSLSSELTTHRSTRHATQPLESQISRSERGVDMD